MKNTIAAILTITSLFVCQAQKKSKEASKMKPQDTELWKPVPPIVKTTTNNRAPSDAIVLFNGSNLDKWQSTKGSKAAKWKLGKDNSMTVVGKKQGGGAIRTKENFGSMQLHLEWRSPKVDINRKGQQRGNSGVFIQGRYEIQVLDNNDNPTYSNGQVASIYKQTIPLAMASVPTGEWNIYDIIYHAPKFDSKNELTKPATITVLHNGILAVDHFELKGPTKYIGIPEYKAHGKAPIMLQDHGSAVSYRNIWLRELKD
jgi:hypothetical protein